MDMTNFSIGELKRKQLLKGFGIDEDADLQKAEGTRGGNVIGHTRSGKPIYNNFEHEGHKGFDYKDHLDASRAHIEKRAYKDGSAAEQHHYAESTKHHNAALKGASGEINKKMNKSEDDELTKGGVGSGRHPFKVGQRHQITHDGKSFPVEITNVSTISGKVSYYGKDSAGADVSGNVHHEDFNKKLVTPKKY
jgi:hypothetical protein